MKEENSQKKRQKREYTLQFKQDAVQMMNDGHKAKEIVKSLGLSSTRILYRWRVEQLELEAKNGQETDSQRIIQLEKQV